MTNNLKRLLADADALTDDARRIDQLGRELNETRAEIIDGLCGLGIKVTAARAMVAKIDVSVVLPESEANAPKPDGLDTAEADEILAEIGNDLDTGLKSAGLDRRKTA